MINHWMFRCKDVSQKVSQAMDTPLPYHQRMAVEVHLLMCRYCARFRRQLVMLRKMSCHIDEDPATTEPATGLSDECRERIKETLRSLP